MRTNPSTISKSKHMRSSVLIILILFLGIQVSTAQQVQEIIKVNTLKQMIRNIKSNKKLILSVYHYDLGHIDSLDLDTDDPVPLEGMNYLIKPVEANADGKLEPVSGSYYLVIRNVENFQLVGRRTSRGITRITSNMPDKNVISFENCKNLKIENIRFEHAEGHDDCEGGVLAFNDCSKVGIDRCELLGSGSTGVTTNKVIGLTMNNTMINDCSKNIMNIQLTKDITFKRCTFKNTPGKIVMQNTREYINVQDIVFEACIFSNLHKEHIFELDINQYEIISIKECTFEGDYKETNLAPSLEQFKLHKNKFEGAKFKLF